MQLQHNTQPKSQSDVLGEAGTVMREELDIHIQNIDRFWNIVAQAVSWSRTNCYYSVTRLHTDSKDVRAAKPQWMSLCCDISFGLLQRKAGRSPRDVRWALAYFICRTASESYITRLAERDEISMPKLTHSGFYEHTASKISRITTTEVQTYRFRPSLFLQ